MSTQLLPATNTAPTSNNNSNTNTNQSHRPLTMKLKRGFLSRFTGHHHQPTPQRQSAQAPSASNSSSVERCVGWLLQSDSNLADWVQVLEFCDRLSINEQDSKETVRIIRKILKHPSTAEIQIRAIRLVVILVLNSSDRFRLQVVNKKFLDLVDDLYTKTSQKAAHQALREMIMRALSVLAYEYRVELDLCLSEVEGATNSFLNAIQNDADLVVLTNLYNKLKPVGAPLNGVPLSETDELFTPAKQIVTPALVSQIETALIPEMRDLRAEAEIARSNARLLIEALAFTTPSEMASNEIIREFHAKSLESQCQLLDDIPWATQQVEQSKQTNSRISAEQSNNGGLPRTDPYAVNSKRDGEPTMNREEQLLRILLDVNNDLIEAFKQFDELEKMRRTEEEIKRVEELSKLDQLNKQDWLSTDDDNEVPKASGSRSSKIIDEHETISVGSSSQNELKPNDLAFNGPSEKVLGKMRRISDRHD